MTPDECLLLFICTFSLCEQPKDGVALVLVVRGQFQKRSVPEYSFSLIIILKHESLKLKICAIEFLITTILFNPLMYRTVLFHNGEIVLDPCKN